VVIEPKWDELWLEFPTGVAGVKQNGKWGFIDRTGRVVMEPQWDVANLYRPSEAEVYWLVARVEEGAKPPTPESTASKPSKVLAKWLDGDGKEIWSSR
jgi:hypothetical protein